MGNSSYWTEFEISHAMQIISNNVRDQESWAEPDFVNKWYNAWEGKLYAYTLISDGVPVACAGLSLMEWEKAEAWALFSGDFQKHKLNIYRTIKLGLNAAFHDKKLVRIQATIDPRWTVNVKWIESLGFQYEGRLRKWGPDHGDHLLYSKVN